jgi:hypothetical protein
MIVTGYEENNYADKKNDPRLSFLYEGHGKSVILGVITS